MCKEVQHFVVAYKSGDSWTNDLPEVVILANFLKIGLQKTSSSRMMESGTEASTSETVLQSTSTAPHKQGAFDMDDKAVLRSAVVAGALALVIGIWAVIKLYRGRSSRTHVRRYDLLSARQLAPDLAVDSEESDDELFSTSVVDQSSRRLVSDHIQLQ